jgi:type VI secretion system secreted protein VgrG
VASFWAGKQWGAIHLPRIGQEVVVDFLEGDPDRPIVVGSVYNAENMPPYSLPDNRTQSTLKSRSSKGGGTDNFNEMRFEDKKGSEEVYFQAEKDLNSLVKNDETRKVQHDRKVTIGNDDSKDVGNDLKLTVGLDRTASIAQDSSETIGGNETVTIAQNQSVTIGGSESHTAVGGRTTTIAGSDSTTVAASVSIMAGGGLTITSGGPVSITAPMISLTAPMVQVAGVLQCITLITTSVVSPTYTPGAGNML